MRKSNNDSGLTALAVLLLTALAVSFTACSTVNTPPIDDAYIYPDKNAPSSTALRESAQSTPTTEVAPQSPTLEILSQKDTTITVRIKR